jgi:hypothetical protein
LTNIINFDIIFLGAIMGTLIQGNFKKRLTLAESKDFLGDYYEKAFTWSIEELRSTVNHPEACLSGADEAYLAILIHREGLSTPPCEVIDLAEYRSLKLKNEVKKPIRYVCEMSLEEAKAFVANK